MEAADVTDPARVEAVTQGAEIVFNTSSPPYSRWPEQFPPLVRGAIEGLRRSGAAMVFADNLYLYGDRNGEPLREDMPYSARTVKGRVRAQMATEILDAAQSGKIRAVIGRASDFYGPRARSSALGEQVWIPILNGKPANLLGSPSQPHAFTFIRDFARGLVRLAGAPDTWGQAWHIPNAPAVSLAELLERVEQEVGHPVKSRFAGTWLVRVLGWFNPLLREMNEMMYEWEKPFLVDHSKFAARFDASHTPLQDGLRETLGWFRDNRMNAAP